MRLFVSHQRRTAHMQFLLASHVLIILKLLLN